MSRYVKKLVGAILAVAMMMGIFIPVNAESEHDKVVGFVTRCYQIALGREPDKAGLEDWVAQLESGKTCGSAVAQGFVFSPEFIDSGIDDATFVEKLYNLLLNRASDAEGKKNWVNALAGGKSRESVFEGFVNSPEFYDLCKGYGIYAGCYVTGSSMQRNVQINTFTDRLYTMCLGRHGDLGGQQDWVRNLAAGKTTGTAAAYGFVFSREYLKKNTSDEDYVELLYNVFLGRASDMQGKAAWLNELKTHSREYVFNGFANSQEFANICKAYGIVKGTANYPDRTYGKPAPTTKPTPSPVAVTGIRLDKTTAKMYTGDSLTLKATVSPSNATDKKVTWSTSDSSVATVSSSGTVKAVKAGKVTITAKTSNGKTAKCTVTVADKVIDVASVTLSQEKADIKTGETIVLTAAVDPEDATDRSIAWISSDESIVTVSEDGEVTGVKEGSAAVTATSSNGISASCEITVTDKAVAVTGVTLNKTTASVYTGDSLTLTATVAPSNATNKTVTWSSGDTSVATVSSSGVVKTLKAGKATITAKSSNGKTASCVVTVTDRTVAVTGVTLNKTTASVYTGDSLTLTATVAPSNATNKTVTWSSGDTSVATVSSSGVVKTLKAGKATITAKSSNGKTASCVVTVTDRTVAVTGVTLNMTTASVNAGGTLSLSATVAPSNATNKTVTWSSDNTSVATVSNGTVTALAKGTAVITAKASNGKSASCTLTVTEQVTVTRFDVPYVSTYYFNPKPSVNDSITIPLYMTDHEQSEYMKGDTSLTLDLIYKVDGVRREIKNIPLGDYNLSLGKLSEGKHIFSVQVRDNRTGLTSPELFNDLWVVNPSTYQITAARTYYMTTADLTKYGIKNNDSKNATDLINTRDGLTKLFADKQAEGYRKIVLLKGTYRINGKNARYECITIPSYFTVDMNGSTFKLDTYTEDIAGCIVFMNDATDAHLINGILEGNRFERQEGGYETDCQGEGINTVLIKGGQYCSLEDLTIRNTTGHTIYSEYIHGPYYILSGYTATEIINGREVASDTCRTSKMMDLTQIKDFSPDDDYVYVGFRGGRRGIRTDSSTVYVSFYDQNQGFLETITACQFRKIRIPDKAKYARVTVLSTDIQESGSNVLNIYTTRLGDYHALKNINFENTRTCAIAVTTCNNLLIEGVTYKNCASSITPVPVDFEDGWEECQDVYYRNNKVISDTKQTTGTVVDNAGFNHVYENCVNHRISINARLVGGVMRNMKDGTTSLRWDIGKQINSGFRRVYNNDCGHIFAICLSHDPEVVPLLVKDCVIRCETIWTLSALPTADKMIYQNCTFPKFVSQMATFNNCTIQPTGQFNDSLYFHDCTFKPLDGSSSITLDLTFGIDLSFQKFDAQRLFENCRFEGKVILGNQRFHSGVFRNCEFDDLDIVMAVDELRGEVVFEGCTINSSSGNLLHTGPFQGTTGYMSVTFKDCVINHTGANVIGFFSTPTDASRVVFDNCTFNKSGGNLIKWLDNPERPSKLEQLSVDIIIRNCRYDASVAIDRSIDSNHARIRIE